MKDNLLFVQLTCNVNSLRDPIICFKFLPAKKGSYVREVDVTFCGNAVLCCVGVRYEFFCCILKYMLMVTYFQV